MSGRAPHHDRPEPASAEDAGRSLADDRVAGRPGSHERVALYLPALHGGGAERVMLNLAQGLLDLGLAVDVVLAQATGAFLGDVPDGARVVDLARGRTLRSLPSLARYLARERPAALVSALNHANLVAVWAARLARYRNPVLVAEHNELNPEGRSALAQRVFVAAMRRTYRRATRVVAVSEGVKATLVETAGIPAVHIEVIYNTVVTPSLTCGSHPAPDHPFFAADAEAPPVILGIGRLTRQKNFANLLRAFARVRAARDARLVILGEGEDRPKLEALVRELGLDDVVSLPGFVRDPYAYLSRAAVFALSSDWEGLPTVLIEALAVGTPVVATDCPNGPSEILDGGRLGRLVPVRDSAALAEALLRTLDEGAGARDPVALERFTVEAATRHYVAAMGLRPA